MFPSKQFISKNPNQILFRDVESREPHHHFSARNSIQFDFEMLNPASHPVISNAKLTTHTHFPLISREGISYFPLIPSQAQCKHLAVVSHVNTLGYLQIRIYSSQLRKDPIIVSSTWLSEFKHKLSMSVLSFASWGTGCTIDDGRCSRREGECAPAGILNDGRVGFQNRIEGWVVADGIWEKGSDVQSWIWGVDVAAVIGVELTVFVND